MLQAIVKNTARNTPGENVQRPPLTASRAAQAMTGFVVPPQLQQECRRAQSGLAEE